MRKRHSHSCTALPNIMAFCLWIVQYFAPAEKALDLDIRFRGPDQKPFPLLYLPLGQHHRPEMVRHIRAAQPKSLIGAMRREVNALDANLPVYDARAFAEHLDAELLDQRLVAIPVSVFAAAAMLLACVGLYGVISQAVGQRTPEIGVRMALEGESHHILKLVMSMGLAFG